MAKIETRNEMKKINPKLIYFTSSRAKFFIRRDGKYLSFRTKKEAVAMINYLSNKEL